MIEQNIALKNILIKYIKKVQKNRIWKIDKPGNKAEKVETKNSNLLQTWKSENKKKGIRRKCNNKLLVNLVFKLLKIDGIFFSRIVQRLEHEPIGPKSSLWPWPLFRSTGHSREDLDDFTGLTGHHMSLKCDKYEALYSWKITLQKFLFFTQKINLLHFLHIFTVTRDTGTSGKNIWIERDWKWKVLQFKRTSDFIFISNSVRRNYEGITCVQSFKLRHRGKIWKSNRIRANVFFGNRNYFLPGYFIFGAMSKVLPWPWPGIPWFDTERLDGPGSKLL